MESPGISRIDSAPDARGEIVAERRSAARATGRLRLELGAQLRGLRNAAGLSQRQLASRIGINVTYLSKMENGKQGGSVRVLRSLAEALDVPVLHLLALAGRVPDEVDVPPAHESSSSSPSRRTFEPPRHATLFVNRDAQIAQVRRILHPDDAGGSLITVTGPAGCGKSRLAAELVWRLTNEGSAVTWLTVREDDNAARLTEALAACGARTSSLVVLDDADLALAASREAATGLLHAGTGVSVLVTSRQRLDLSAERRIPLTGLAVPDKHLRPNPGPGVKPDLDRLQTQESVNLFVDRARLVAPGFQLDRTNASAVFDLCLWLDGLPLAIELAALRLRQMTVVDLAAELDDLLTWLEGNTIDAPQRHASLQTAIGWSFDQLTEEQRTVAARLCTFSASFRRGDAVEVAGDDKLPPARIIAAVMALVDRSLLVMSEDGDGRGFYRWPHPVRQLGRRLLDASPDVARTTRERYARWCWRVAKEPVRSEAEWARLADLTPDLFAAVHRLPAEEQPEAITLLTGDATNVLAFGHPDGRWLVDQLSAKGEGRTDVFLELGMLARVHGNFEQAKTSLERALQAAENQRDQLGQANTLVAFAETATDQNGYEDAERYAAQARGLYEKLNDKGGLSEILNLQGKIRLGSSEPQAAERLFEEALRMAAELDDLRRIAYSQNNLGVSDLELGRVARARDRLERSLAIRQQMQNLRGVARIIEAFALIESEVENHETVLLLLGAARQYRESSGMKGVSPWWSGRLDRVLERARAALAASPDAVDSHLRLGAAMSLADAGALAVPARIGSFREPLPDASTRPLRRPLPEGAGRLLRPRAKTMLEGGRRDAVTPLERALVDLKAGTGSMSEVHRQLNEADLLAIGAPLDDGTNDLLSFALPPDVHRGLVVPVFTGPAALADVLGRRREWADRPVVSVGFDRLRSDLIRGETLVINPWLPSEYRYSVGEPGHAPAVPVDERGGLSPRSDLLDLDVGADRAELAEEPFVAAVEVAEVGDRGRAGDAEAGQDSHRGGAGVARQQRPPRRSKRARPQLDAVPADDHGRAHLGEEPRVREAVRPDVVGDGAGPARPEQHEGEERVGIRADAVAFDLEGDRG